MGDLMYEGENYAELLTTKYAEDILKLSRYIPYFEKMRTIKLDVLDVKIVIFY